MTEVTVNEIELMVGWTVRDSYTPLQAAYLAAGNEPDVGELFIALMPERTEMIIRQVTAPERDHPRLAYYSDK